MMKKSIRRQMATIFIALVGALLLVAILINSLFLENYYIHNKQSSLIEIYEVMDKASKKNRLTDQNTVDKLSELVEVGNISFVVTGDNGIEVMSAAAAGMVIVPCPASLDIRPLFTPCASTVPKAPPKIASGVNAPANTDLKKNGICVKLISISVITVSTYTTAITGTSLSVNLVTFLIPPNAITAVPITTIAPTM